MKAIRIHERGNPEQLIYEDAPQPHAGPGEVLVRVYASGIIANELHYNETYQTRTGTPRTLPIPGHDLAGVIEEIGTGVTMLRQGEEVYALIAFDRDGAEAEYTLALPSELAPKPRSLDFVQAAAVPLSALTAWQALFDHAGLVAGQTILIHGAAGGVGVFAVQLAHRTGAHVIATASTHNHDFLRELGADETIDYTTTFFEKTVHDVDVVLDMVGGDTLERSWQVMKQGGVLVTVVSPRFSHEEAKRLNVRPVFFVVEPNREQLVQIGKLIDAEQIRPIIDTVLPLSQTQQAYKLAAEGHTRGKIILQVEVE